jgi:hypothetical protein
VDTVGHSRSAKPPTARREGTFQVTRLLNTGPGEWSDRLTILSLKILFGTEQGKDVTHFQTEQTALLQQIRSRTLNGKWFAAYTELAAVNAALWHAEDEMRDWRSRWKPSGPDETGISGPGSGYMEATAMKVVQCAFRVQALNDQRAALVQQINKDAGEMVGMEKL